MSNKTIDTITAILMSIFIITFIWMMIVKISDTRVKQDHDLEIYSKEDIIYIQGLTVTFESREDTLRFKDKESLRVYISNLTSNNIK